MKVGEMSIPDSLVDMSLKEFKKYHSKVMAKHVTETAEEVYVMLGGKLPKAKEPKEKKVKGENAPE